MHNIETKLNTLRILATQFKDQKFVRAYQETMIAEKSRFVVLLQRQLNKLIEINAVDFVVATKKEQLTAVEQYLKQIRGMEVTDFMSYYQKKIASDLDTLNEDISTGLISSHHEIPSHLKTDEKIAAELELELFTK